MINHTVNRRIYTDDQSKKNTDEFVWLITECERSKNQDNRDEISIEVKKCDQSDEMEIRDADRSNQESWSEMQIRVIERER